jgi:glycosyltransferase involved in cell wall biosynthesis
MAEAAQRDIGVVTIGRNEGQRLIDCLESLRSATVSIVYVDSGSVDDSVNVAKKVGAHVVNLDMSKPFTAARARNEGFRALKGITPTIQFVQFVDGDCILDQFWIDKALAFMEAHPDVAVVCGRRRERNPKASIYNRLLDDEWNTPIGETTACGGDALFRVVAFEKVNGFRPEIMAGEEPELCLRLRECGWKILRLDEEMTRHDAAMYRFDQWWKRSVRSGYGFAELTLRYRMTTWRRNIVGTTFWAAALPLAIAGGALIHPIALLGILAYPLQVFRLGFRGAPRSSPRWSSAVLSIPTKFAVMQGILTFFWQHLLKRTTRIIEYKDA